MGRLIPKRLASSFKYEALRAGSMSLKTKHKYYDKLYRSLTRQSETFSKSEFSELEFQKAMAEQLLPRSQIDADELDARLSLMYRLYDEQAFSVQNMEEQRAFFYDEYSEDLSRNIFYTDRGEMDTETYVKFTNFVQLAHHSHIEDLYSSDLITDFKNSYGIEELREFASTDELYTEFFEYMERQEAQMKKDVSW